MGLTRAVSSEGPYADEGREKQDEAVSLESAGSRRLYSTTVPHGGAVFPLWTDFSRLPSDKELETPRFYMLGPLFSAVETARQHLEQNARRGEDSCLFSSEH
jgi:hypothetical protein